MKHARELAAELEARAELPETPGRERFWGYAVVGVPFRSGHILAMRRFPATSIGPGYTSVWHRDPTGRWVIYQDQTPLCTCPRGFGPAIDDAPTVPIRLEWTGSHRFCVDIDTEDIRLHWDVPLSQSAVTRGLNAIAAVLPQRVRHHPVALAAMSRTVGPLLRAGRLRLSGKVPAGVEFFADLRRVWLIERSAASIDGTDLGEPGPLPAQERLADFWLPQRGLFAVGGSFFEPYDPARHLLVASRRELERAERAA